jgi:hypothetical protein
MDMIMCFAMRVVVRMLLPVILGMTLMWSKSAARASYH